MTSIVPSAPDAGASSAGYNGATSLRERLASVLPQGYKFGVHHISTPPTRTEPLCPAPPGQRPDKTYRESHFLAVSIHPPDKATTAAPAKRSSPGADQPKAPEVRDRTLAFAVEVFVFTTAYQTTLFVSKADSTGYLHLLGLPKDAPSPIRQVCTTFLAYLLDHRRRNHVQSVVNLFARAQSQYLFPGSVHNSGKHVLDDWGLVRWWCRVLNPLIEVSRKGSWAGTKGYLLVPGLEEGEMRAFIPRTPGSGENWTIGHPLERISHHTRDLGRVPPRCLIPGYPDDPKARFRDELDEEVSNQKQNIAAWKSVRSLEQFWEMMAFRQECSSGRLTGFIWLVFDPNPLEASAQPHVKIPRAASSKTDKKRLKKKQKKLTGPIIPRAPRIKTHVRNSLVNRPTMTAYYYWPPEGRGDKLVTEADYKRIMELLLHLDFSTIEKAVGSSRRWINEAGVGDDVVSNVDVVGKAALSGSSAANGPADSTSSAAVTNLTSLVRRKNAPRPSDHDIRQSAVPTEPAKEAPVVNASIPQQVNILSGSLVRKRKGDAQPTDAPGSS
ncbi:hypothetical protein VTJ83DRAFT_5285 [Remersonia thermophila]|uniref:histone acetyltransferase n=1 Tax=Remersonia thermophila TaxID=72144 RepID=A0ABR4D6H8_9PEZI